MVHKNYLPWKTVFNLKLDFYSVSYWFVFTLNPFISTRVFYNLNNADLSSSMFLVILTSSVNLNFEFDKYEGFRNLKTSFLFLYSLYILAYVIMQLRRHIVPRFGLSYKKESCNVYREVL